MRTVRTHARFITLRASARVHARICFMVDTYTHTHNTNTHLHSHPKSRLPARAQAHTHAQSLVPARTHSRLIYARTYHYTYTHTHTQTHTHTHKHARTYAHTQNHACTRARAHTHTHSPDLYTCRPITARARIRLLEQDSLYTHARTHAHGPITRRARASACLTLAHTLARTLA